MSTTTAEATTAAQNALATPAAIPPPAGAATSAEAAKADSVLGAMDAFSRADTAFSWSGYLQAIGFLFLIIALLFFALWYLKRKGGIKLLTGHGDLFIESRLALGPKKSLFVVRFLNKRLLLGVTDQQITTLAELPNDENNTDRTESDKPKASEFKEHLARASTKDIAE